MYKIFLLKPFLEITVVFSSISNQIICKISHLYNKNFKGLFWFDTSVYLRGAHFRKLLIWNIYLFPYFSETRVGKEALSLIERHYMNLHQTLKIKLEAVSTCSLFYIHVGESISVHVDSKWGSSAVRTPCCWLEPSTADVLLFKDEQTGKKSI